MRLKGDEGGLEVRPDADTRDNLEDDDFGPAAVGVKVDEEAVAERHEEESDVDWRQVESGFADEDSGCDGGEGEGYGGGEEVDTGEEGACATHGLEVEGEVVGGGDEDEAVDEAAAEGGNVRAVVE